ncbi:PAS domain-containing sensor histidine kinase [Hymenobacter cellulosilyticus]|uniref:histidine kinase n=1 Tax=Hymenobacter cellulosilyticus TaxID=2932248 RepID=A0A8T9Q284_9BACT|nr:PAS domain-containing sensor histidine kinase [Hymenobacter cellulosilyticus]UOQ71634.1 PAS domain-containing sensor histidine kinase [Hymenobacter cellulosilyticus]
MTDYYALFRPLLESGRAAYFVYQPAEHRVVYVSEAFQLITGDPAEHVNDDLPHLLKRLHPDDQQYLASQLEQAQFNQVLEGLELRMARSNGSTLWLSVNLCRVQGPDGQEYLTGSALDVTQGKENTLNLQKFGTKKNAVLEILSHDLAGPLQMLQQLTEQLELETQGNLSAHAQKMVSLMQRTCRDSVNMIHDFVDAEFMESSSVELNLTRTDLVVWVGLLLEEYQRSESLLHLQFNFVAPDYPVYVNIDIDKFHQVVNNLVSNAVKFTPDGGQITVRVELDNTLARVVVADTGVGIPAKYQPVLFDKFTKARRPGLRGEKTTGLGMSVIQTIVELHQGQITFTSTEGEGSTFVVDLPATTA